MTGKYIVELKDRETLYKAAIGGNGEPYISTAMKNVYKEPDLDAIRNEAYEKGVQDTKQHWVDAPRSCAYKLGYENGLKAAWEAARKISTMDSPTRDEIFGLVITSNILDENSASEVIEKILQYEQEQQIQVGDEVVFYNGEKCVVTVVGDGQVAEVMDKGGFSMRMDDGLRNSMKKTGRHFPEIVEVLKKMKERE